MKTKQLIKSAKPKEKGVKPLCGTYGGTVCTGNFGTGDQPDVLL